MRVVTHACKEEGYVIGLGVCFFLFLLFFLLCFFLCVYVVQ